MGSSLEMFRPHCSQHRDADGQRPGALLAHPAAGHPAVQVLLGRQERPADGARATRGGPAGNRSAGSRLRHGHRNVRQSWSCSGLTRLLTPGSPMALFMTGTMETFPGGCWGNWGYGPSSHAAVMPGAGFPGSRHLDTNRQCQSLHQHLGRVKCPTGFGDQNIPASQVTRTSLPAFDCCSSLVFSPGGRTCCACPGAGAADGIHACSSPSSGAEANDRWVSRLLCWSRSSCGAVRACEDMWTCMQQGKLSC